MWKWILAAIIFLPAIEIFGFQYVAEQVGGMNTLLLTLLTSAIGVAMMRFEGRKAMEDAKLRMNSGMVPGSSMADGLCIFLGGMLLILPGFVTDIIGFTMVFPLTRPLYKLLLLKWLMKNIKDGKITIFRR
ncbi:MULTISPECIES: FxsA family protein [Paenibacillus]|uniref:Membrane protein FxsA n=1 Tax=Paenibacillus campinasensis TaxID=66347 RepID=A0A268F1F3_9BACL|nr:MULTISPECIES: FxsA family protein [Paenibacillus]MUG65764.1 membrane protein FxsA [Paenibacillus campinasensis]PAD79200.1 membrane protein FxsA [Paenibacillus campinasensis]PAK54194.1 membrane protein FxsA [Paenibacillus sp. 7541]